MMSGAHALHGIVMLSCTEMSYIVLAVVMSCQIMHRGGILSCAEICSLRSYDVTREEAWGLLDPSVRDVAHDGVLCTHCNRSAPDRSKCCGPSGQAAWTVHQVQNHTLLDHSSSQPGGPSCWASLLARLLSPH